MTLFTYTIFETIVHEKSFQKAATLLNMTPSAVSHAVSAMEKEVGFSLFIRGKQETVLTNQGELLLPYVREVLKSEESLRQAVAEFHGLEKEMAMAINCIQSGLRDAVEARMKDEKMKAAYKIAFDEFEKYKNENPYLWQRIEEIRSLELCFWKFVFYHIVPCHA